MSANRKTPIVALKTRPSFGFLICLPLLLSLLTPMVASTIAQDEPAGLEPTDIWSDDYIDTIFPWAPASDRILQFKEYHTYETMKTRMMKLAEDNPDIFEYHEGMNGGTNARAKKYLQMHMRAGTTAIPHHG